jgi:hypothetical protein
MSSVSPVSLNQRIRIPDSSAAAGVQIRHHCKLSERTRRLGIYELQLTCLKSIERALHSWASDGETPMRRIEACNPCLGHDIYTTVFWG